MHGIELIEKEIEERIKELEMQLQDAEKNQDFNLIESIRNEIEEVKNNSFIY